MVRTIKYKKKSLRRSKSKHSTKRIKQLYGGVFTKKRICRRGASVINPLRCKEYRRTNKVNHRFKTITNCNDLFYYTNKNKNKKYYCRNPSGFFGNNCREKAKGIRGLCEESKETKSPNINSFRLDDTGDGRTIRDQLNSTNQAAEALLDQTISLVGLERLEQQRKEAQARSIIGLPPDPDPKIVGARSLTQKQQLASILAEGRQAADLAIEARFPSVPQYIGGRYY